MTAPVIGGGSDLPARTIPFRVSWSRPSAAFWGNPSRYPEADAPIGIYSCKEASGRFHARLNAKTKTYRYRIWNSDAPCVFDRRFVAVIHEKLDVEAMEKAAAFLLGEHDFSAFCAAKSKKKSTIRRIDAISISREGEELRFDVTGNGFLYNMVRILVGTLVEVGMGQRDPDSIPLLFGAPRSEAGMLMIPQGLCLMEVTY